MTKTVGLATALAVGGAIALSPGQAFAHEQSGFGVGADLTLANGGSSGGLAAGVGGLNGMYWVSDTVALNFIVNVGIASLAEEADVTFALGGAFGVFGVLASGDSTHLMLGGRLGIRGVFNETGRPDFDDNRAVISLDVPLRVEHWFDRHFSVNGQVGLGIGITPDSGGGSFAAILGSANAWGGFGFNFYFDPASGLAVPGGEEEHHHAEPPPRSQPRAQPVYQAPPPAAEEAPPADPEAGSAGW